MPKIQTIRRRAQRHRATLRGPASTRRRNISVTSDWLEAEVLRLLSGKLGVLKIVNQKYGGWDIAAAGSGSVTVKVPLAFHKDAFATVMAPLVMTKDNS